MHFNLRNIEQLKPFKLREKQQIIAIAISQLEATERVLLSCCKLAILMPLAKFLMTNYIACLVNVVFVFGFILDMVTN